jgi:hypothetical protein
LFDEENQRVLELAGNLSIINADDPTLRKVEKKLKEVATELLKNWEERQTKTILQATTFDVFGIIHEIDDQDPIQHEIMLRLLKKVINSLPPRQKELFDEDTCLAGFLSWNEFWKTSFAKESENRAKNLLTAQEPLKNVHIFYRNWVKVASGHYSEFQDLWEIVMIRSVSEAICETIGSMMN